MKIGDLVRIETAFNPIATTGIIVEIIDDITVPEVCIVLLPNGRMCKEWKDELEVVSESR